MASDGFSGFEVSCVGLPARNSLHALGFRRPWRRLEPASEALKRLCYCRVRCTAVSAELNRAVARTRPLAALPSNCASGEGPRESAFKSEILVAAAIQDRE